MNGLAVVGAALQALLMALIATPILRRLPAPVDEPDTDPYRPLATPTFTAVAAGLSFAGWLVIGTVVPLAVQPAWLALNTLGVLLGLIDLRTTFVPAVLNRIAWILAAIGVGITAIVMSAWWPVVYAAVGAGIAAGLYALFWRFGRGFGFGDVRLAALTGGVSATMGASVFGWTLFAGSIVGVVLGLIAISRGRGREYAYGPALVIGPYLALIGALLGLR